MKLKICGMKYPGNILEVGSLLPDYLGFIFWEKSTRYFEGVMPDLPVSIKKVGVFVNASSSVILAKAQMMVCGVLGPKSNAHGPNEFLHVPYAKKITAAVAHVIAQMP